MSMTVRAAIGTTWKRPSGPDVNPPGVVTFPDASTTGAHPQSGTVNDLPLYSGPTSITSNTTITGMKITSRLTVEDGATLTVSECYSTTGDYYGFVVFDGGHLNISDTTIDNYLSNALFPYDLGTFTALRIDVSGGDDGLKVGNNCILRDSFIHDLSSPDPQNAHYDGINADSYRGWEITGNTVINDYSQTSAIYIGDPRGRDSSGLLDGNFLKGGGYTIYAGPGDAGTNGLRVRNNVIFVDASALPLPIPYYGYATYWYATNNEWTNNKDQLGNVLAEPTSNG